MTAFLGKMRKYSLDTWPLVIHFDTKLEVFRKSVSGWYAYSADGLRNVNVLNLWQERRVPGISWLSSLTNAWDMKSLQSRHAGSRDDTCSQSFQSGSYVLSKVSPSQGRHGQLRCLLKGVQRFLQNEVPRTRTNVFKQLKILNPKQYSFKQTKKIKKIFLSNMTGQYL